jgi:predicted glycoside hydrolase/deacetylase ChbG (UPF0249 family)
LGSGVLAERSEKFADAAPAARDPDSRHIWLCADDYGISRSVNSAIRDLIVRGRINATSVMVVAPSFDRSEAIPLAILNAAGRRVAIGLHLTLTAPFAPLSSGFRPLVAGAFPPLRTVLRTAGLRFFKRETLVVEIEAQLRAFTSAFGYSPDFVDGHQHVHLLPGIREAVLQVVKDKLPKAWVRQCGRALPLHRRFSDRKGMVLDTLSRGFRRRAARYGVRTNPAFAGTYDFRADADFARLFPTFLQRLPEGSVIMCHPGMVDAELERLDPLTSLREREYAYFADESFPGLLAAHGVTLA